jgi:hypothetical protein
VGHLEPQFTYTFENNQRLEPAQISNSGKCQFPSSLLQLKIKKDKILLMSKTFPHLNNPKGLRPNQMQYLLLHRKQSELL